MANDTRTIRELWARNYDTQPLFIAYPPMGANANFELKGYFIHSLPMFHGYAGDDPNRHLSEFHMMCEGAIPNGVTEDQFKLRAFPFSLQDAAKDWLFYLQPGTIHSWKDMKAAFLKKYYPDSRHNHEKKAITSLEQDASESLYEYWERFKKLVAQCPYHGLSGDDHLVKFCDGLTQQYQIMVNSATGVGVDNYSVAEANEIIKRLDASTRNYGRSRGSKTINSIETPSSSNNKLEKTVDELTRMVSQLVGNNQEGAQGSNVECTYYQGPHPMETCPIMEEQGISKENVSAMMHGQYNSRNPNGGGYYKYDPSGNTYNIGSRDNANLSWGGDTSRSFQNGQLNHLRNSNSQGQSTNYQRNNNLQQVKGGSFQFGNQGNHKNFQGGGSFSQGDEDLSTKKMFKMLMKEQIEEEIVIEEEKGTPSKANGEEEVNPLSKDKGKKESTNTNDQIEEIERECVEPETNVVIQLADRSTIHPKGLVEDVLVEVDKFMFPVDFYVLDMEPDSKATPLLLGRHFMRTSKTKLDMYDGNLTMEFEGKIVRYNVYETMKKTYDLSFCYFLDESIEALEEKEPLEEAKEEEEIKEIEEQMPSKVAFDSLKERLVTAPIIQAPKWDLPFEIMTDASDYAIGAVLCQREGKVAHVIQYASSLLNDAQRNYTTTEKEFLAVVYAIENF
ncbi:uncharacterized protein LOC141632152 [Silene latifolia]|uniref:uncharacterized protein LOC141632152 n=1 Tax=Silene latifolia TaxID=37657 RepID=UPI003D7791D8